MKVYDDNPTYTIYQEDRFFGTFDYIIMVKDHTNGEEFKLMDDKIATYVCDKINRDIYIFAVKSLGGGKFGGAGAGSNF